MRKCRACVGGAEGRAGVGEAGCAASAQRTQTTGDADLTACARTSRLLARTSRLRARADCVGVRAAARADRADARAPLGATYARATLTHGRFLLRWFVQACLTMLCLTVVTDCPLIRKASDQTEGCSGPTRYLLMVTGLCFSQKGENPVF